MAVTATLVAAAAAQARPRDGAAAAVGGRARAEGAVVSWDATLQGRFVTCMARARDGSVWCGTEDSGVWRFDPSAPAPQAWRRFGSADGLGTDSSVYALACDRLGRVWAGTLRSGVAVYNGVRWRTYGPGEGPLGSRVFAIAVSPKDGDVWLATDAGLARYSEAAQGRARWSYYGRPERLPSDQANALAFSVDGTLYVGTQCDGLAIGSPSDGFRRWRVVRSSRSDVCQPAGDGLPCDLVNAVIVAREGTVFVGTTAGLAWSRDQGRNWRYVRGANWEAKARGRRVPLTIRDNGERPNLLLEDYVTALAQDARGRIWIGHRRKGIEIIDAKTMWRDDVALSADGYVTALLPLEAGVLAGTYGAGATGVDPGGARCARALALAPKAASPAAFPPEAPGGSVAELVAAVVNLERPVQTLQRGQAVYFGEDWATQGDWVGRYGRQYARLYAAQSPYGDHFPMSSPGYVARPMIGPNHAEGDALRNWVHWVQTDNVKCLYNPLIGSRRQSEADDHGEAYDLDHEGPDIWVRVSVPDGVHRVSVYNVNKDGQDGDNRLRDYLLDLKPYRPRIADAEGLPSLARCRMRDFWGGVYKSFLVRGPALYWLKVARNDSLNTILAATFIDRVDRAPGPGDGMDLHSLGGVRIDPPLWSEPGDGLTEGADAAVRVWNAAERRLAAGPLDPTTALRARLLAYRAAVVGDVPSAALAAWRWPLHIWLPEDRTGFASMTGEAYRARQDKPAATEAAGR